MQIAMTAECFFLTKMLYAARNLNAPFPFSFTRIEWVNCFLKERSCVEQNETGKQSSDPLFLIRLLLYIQCSDVSTELHIYHSVGGTAVVCEWPHVGLFGSCVALPVL